MYKLHSKERHARIQSIMKQLSTSNAKVGIWVPRYLMPRRATTASTSLHGSLLLPAYRPHQVGELASLDGKNEFVA
jgi:hypothetical protein